MCGFHLDLNLATNDSSFIRYLQDVNVNILLSYSHKETGTSWKCNHFVLFSWTE